MTQTDLNELSKEELITLIQRERNYNRLLNKAIRHYAASLLKELKQLRNET